MKFWILKPRDELESNNPWRPRYCKTFGFVVRAETEVDARALAASNAGDEGPNAWWDSQYSTCTELSPEGDACVVMEHHVED